jgi:hypothetical protein
LDRCALFVDAGYALGDGALAVHGTRHRDSVSWDYAGLLKLLSGLSADRTGLPLLRCYWYDVAPAGAQSADHDSLADLPGVKLRLSKARPSRREGVETEMRKDLTALARNHAVSDVVIVSAEEDLAPAIAEVQEFGVRAVLLYIGADSSEAGSRALRQECDASAEVSASHLRPFVELIAGAEPQAGNAGYREQLVSSGAPQAGNAGYREQLVSSGAPQRAIEAAGQRPFASGGPAEYDRAAALTAASSQGEEERDFGARGDAGGLGPARRGDNGHARAAQQSLDSQPAQFVPVGYYDPAAEAMAAGLPAPAEAGFGHAQFAGQSTASAANGHGAIGQQGMAPSHLPGRASIGGPGMMGNGLAQVGPPGPGAGGMPGPGGSANGAAANGMPEFGGDVASGMPAAGARPGGLPSSGPPDPRSAGGIGPAPGGLGQQGYPAALQGMTSPPLTAQPQHGLGQQLTSPAPMQQGLAQQGQNMAAQPGAHRHAGGPGGPQGQNGLLSLESQRPPLPVRQLPAGSGMPYGEDQRMPYAGQLPQGQLAGPAGQQQYGQGGYGGQPAQLAAPAPSIGDAVQSAHAEGFGFGEAVARDAPALWLEAVLARKPRMPSDLEARLLQGSALPIDSLLHDEVRHALRRGFWDALERARH